MDYRYAVVTESRSRIWARSRTAVDERYHFNLAVGDLHYLGWERESAAGHRARRTDAPAQRHQWFTNSRSSAS